jgi:hypothetical protein
MFCDSDEGKRVRVMDAILKMMKLEIEEIRTAFNGSE